MIAASLSIVIPVYNEERRLDRLIEELSLYADDDVTAAGLRLHEIIVVDDGSVDRTVSRLEAARERVPSLRILAAGAPNAGKGEAIARGVSAATGDWVLMSDADLATPLDQLAALTGVLERGVDVVVASRDVPGSIVTGAPRHRFVLGRAFNKLVRLLTGLEVRDSQCGFKLMRTADARQLTRGQRVRRWAFDVELLVRARRAGLRVVEAPVYYVHGEDSKLNALTVAPRMAFDVVQIALRLGPWRPMRSTRR